VAAKIRPATPKDVAALIAEPLPWRIRAFAMEDDGKLLAVGGFTFMPGDTVAAFLIKAEGAERYPVTLHRAGITAMRTAVEAGYRRIVALADKTNPAAERWLVRFGYKLHMIDGIKTWIWERNG
jgi:hypothetical protein